MDERVRHSLDWHSYPYVALGLAVAGGFVIGRMLKPRRSPADRLAQSLADNFGDAAWPGQTAQPRSSLLKAAGAALAAVAVRSAGDYMMRTVNPDRVEPAEPGTRQRAGTQERPAAQSEHWSEMV